jgi:RimJ/RimL family protein N-acetyltransferase
LHQQCTKPDWCVVGFNNETPVARAALWAVPEEAVPTDVVLIAADWSDPDLSEAQALLAYMHKLTGTLGAGALQHHIDSPPGPPQYQENESARVRLMTEAGYNLLRDGLRWLRTRSAVHDTHAGPSLSFHNVAEVGEDAFVAALAATYEGTLDSMLTRHIQEHGLLGAAQSDFRDYQEMEYLPHWWELAYTEDGVLAGVVMPARNPSSAVIAYVGVVPERRGRGLAPQLVGRATDQLLAAGAEQIRGDCDRDNVAMAKAFRRAGYEQFARRRSYQRTLGEPTAALDN